jgi:hypothetical protein
MGSRIFSLFFLVVSSSRLFGQVDDSRIRQIMLRNNNTDSIYKFQNRKDSSETYLHYLGILKSRNGRAYKIMTSCWRWGLDLHRATNRILIFNSRNQYLGNYYVTTTDDLPAEIKANKLIFSNPHNSDCDPNIYTAVSFTDGIPKRFFRKCKGQYGDIYCFGND